MSRTTTLTIAFLLLFVGLKLRTVQSYQLTPSATKFWIERIEDPEIVAKQGLQNFNNSGPSNSMFQSASYSNYNQMNPLPAPQKVVTPPTWICWPIFFLGAFMFLTGLSMPKD